MTSKDELAPAESRKRDGPFKSNYEAQPIIL